MCWAVFDKGSLFSNWAAAMGLLEEALRVTHEGGVVPLSTPSDSFWPHRLAWFDAQAAEGLVGGIDRIASQDGVIVCEDGFRPGRLTPDEFRSLAR
jgi:2-polyprenyl-6-hydroxyphenyl methylase/3-demethylubiquinone-9 3-methyltransferase